MLNKTRSEDKSVHVQDESIVERLMAIQCEALLTPVSDCEIVLQLDNIKLDEIKDQSREDVQEFLRRLRLPIAFGYKHGVVTDVCSETEDDWYTINLKKSIISSLQTSPKVDDKDTIRVS